MDTMGADVVNQLQFPMEMKHWNRSGLMERCGGEETNSKPGDLQEKFKCFLRVFFCWLDLLFMRGVRFLPELSSFLPRVECVSYFFCKLRMQNPLWNTKRKHHTLSTTKVKKDAEKKSK